MKDTDFWETYGTAYGVDQSPPYDYFVWKGNDSNILGVAHLDSVDDSGLCGIIKTGAGWVVYSGALDDRLGVYVITELLPKLGVTCDWLLTTGEESGRSTAAFFSIKKQYNWMFQFDRGGTDVVMYDYECKDLRDRVRESGALIGNGSFSDICSLDHLNCKGVNWGVGYRDYHSPRSHAYLEDTFKMVEQFLRFYEDNKTEHLPHSQSFRSSRYEGWGDYFKRKYDKDDENDNLSQWTYKAWKERQKKAETKDFWKEYDEQKIHDLPQPVNSVDDILEEGRAS